jgi:limonene-1,2-epoxide hydrolase
MRTAPETVNEFIVAFKSAWPHGDVDRLASFFSEDAVYHNGPLDPIEGREAIVLALAGFIDLGGDVDVDITHMLGDDSIVMTERVDHFIGRDKTISLRVMGIFEVHEGTIRAWRDYFDLNEFSSQATGEDQSAPKHR